MAQGGILFLDEIGELPMSLQSKLLRVLQENEIYRIGGISPIKTDARIIAATNKDMSAMVRAGEFREDLYYRLNVFPIRIPSLRERKEDIGILIRLLAKQYNEKFGIEKIIENAAIEYMTKYDWPGNIRELQNVVQRILIKSESSLVKLKDMRDLNYFEGLEKSGDPQEKGGMLRDIPELKLNNRTLPEALEEMEAMILRQYKAEFQTTRRIAKALGLTQSGAARRLIKYSIK
jgi:transcriptional regulator with PAS, ATPase and Fis domain